MDRQARQDKDATSAAKVMGPADETLHEQVNPNRLICRKGRRPVLEAVMDGRLPANAAAWITQYALSLAELTEPVCVVHIYRDTSHLQLVQLPFSQAANAASWCRSLPATPPDSIPGGFFQIIKSLAEHPYQPVRHWLFRLCDPDTTQAVDILNNLKRWTIVLGTDNVSLAGGYCLLKHVYQRSSHSPTRRVGVVMMGDDESQCRHAHWKFNLISASVLRRRVELIGSHKKIHSARGTYLGKVDLDNTFWPRCRDILLSKSQAPQMRYENSTHEHAPGPMNRENISALRASGSPRPPATLLDNHQVEDVRCMQEKSCGSGRLITSGTDA